MTNTTIRATLTDGTEVGVGDTVAFKDHDASRFLTVDSFGVTAVIEAIHHRGAESDNDGWVIDLVRDSAPFVDENYAPKGFGWEFFEGVRVDGEKPGRPLVHFDDDKAGRDRSKARDAAAYAISRSNKREESNVVLAAAARGESVDAYALNAAVLDAMRSATTRLGQSSGRRVMAKQFAHLGHIVQAVLENHADNLPGYEPGARSRLLTEAHDAIGSAKREIDHLTTALADVNARHTARLDELAAYSAETRAQHAAELADAERARVVADNALDYVARFLTPEQIAQVQGFKDGVATEYDYRQDA